MTRETAAPSEDDLVEYEDFLERLRRENAPAETIGEAAMRHLERLLELEQTHLAAYHAGGYGDYWDDGRKLEILALMARHGMEAQAITLCHRWKLSELCHKKNRRLYRELFPKLPPRTEKKERP